MKILLLLALTSLIQGGPDRKTPQMLAAVAGCAPVVQVLPVQEHLSFSVYYQLGLIWVGAGDLNLTLQPAPLPGQPEGPLYPHGVAIAHSSDRINLFFPVNDRYETWFDPQTVLPVHYVRDIQEGKTRFYWEYQYDRQAGSIHYKHRSKRSNEEGQVKGVSNCIGDLFSTLYYMRSVDWSSYRVGQRAPLDLIIDGKPQQLSVKLVGRERIKTRLGYTNCLVLQPQLITGDYFKDDDGLTLWLSDDGRRLPVRCEAKILVGALKADLLPE